MFVKKLCVAAVLVAMAASAQAGVAEKKATVKAVEKIEKAIEKTKAQCGNAHISYTVNWVNVLAFEDMEYARKRLISAAGGNAASVFKQLAGICKKDADYKEEIAKLTTVNFTSQLKDNKAAHNSYSLKEDGQVLDISLVAKYGYSGTKLKKALKNIW